jgi:hypothetical protein
VSTGRGRTRATGHDTEDAKLQSREREGAHEWYLYILVRQMPMPNAHSKD